MSFLVEEIEHGGSERMMYESSERKAIDSYSRVMFSRTPQPGDEYYVREVGPYRTFKVTHASFKIEETDK